MKIVLFNKEGKTFCRLLRGEMIKMYLIPKDFEFDGASIPKWLWSFLGHPFESKFLKASCLHDWLYKSGEASRSEADKLFRRVLIRNGVGKIKSWLMYATVRIFGAKNYNKK